MTYDPQRNPPETLLRQLFDTAVARAQPLQNLAAFIPERLPEGEGRVVVLGAGKAAGAMAQAFEQLWLERFGTAGMARISGRVITRYGHTPPRPLALKDVPPRVDIVEASHPVPDAAGLAATEALLDLTQGLSANDLVVCLISGGGSALLTLPAAQLSFTEKQRVNQELLNSGAHIGEMNCVRKHLSRIKGGHLLAACAPARVLTLAISDVPGDDPAVIASGPTVPDSTTCGAALEILQRYQISIPPAVRTALQNGALETPKQTAVRHETHVVATPRAALLAAAEQARQHGLHAYILGDDVEGEARVLGASHAALARATAAGYSGLQTPCVILSGGETTVTIRERSAGAAKGRGGRAGEYGMGLVQGLQAAPNIYALAADTDGIDGIEDNAGVWVQPSTLVDALSDSDSGAELKDCLARNDSYGFFSAAHGLVVTGPTHTNVNDFRAVLVL